MAVKKKGALELSIGTIVILVLAMTMLVLGLVLVRGIFNVATDSVDNLGDKVKNEIINLFTDESKNVVVKLGSDQTAKIKPGTNDFGIAVGARTKDGSAVTSRQQLQYKLTLDTTSTSSNCAGKLGESVVRNMFQQKVDGTTFVPFDEYQDDSAFARVIVDVPDGTAICSQKVFVDVKDTRTNQAIGGTVFIVEVIKKGLF